MFIFFDGYYKIWLFKLFLFIAVIFMTLIIVLNYERV